jgi:GT2 family glycosyltransferase
MEAKRTTTRSTSTNLRKNFPLVSIIIVHYKVQKELFACLNSLKKLRSNYSFEIIVVDNDEVKIIKETLHKQFSTVQYIESPGNIGFGGGNNLGARYAKGQYLFFLNPDTKVNPNTLDILVNFLKAHTNTGIIAPLLVDKNNKPFILQGTQELTPTRAFFAHSFINKISPNNPISRKFWLKEWDKKTVKKVETAPGTAFLISKDLFEKIGKFDEKFFLYFEEDDIAQRLRKIGKEIYITPEAKVFHAIGKSMKKSEHNTSEIFVQSRYYYFRKHFGFVRGSLIEWFLRLKKGDFLFFLIFLLGIFLRFFHKHDNFYFDGEIGDNLLDIKNYYLHQTIPLLGPPTSHPWLYFGPLFYWLYGPILILSKFNPISYTYFGTFFSCLVIIANYFFTKKLFNSTAALISSYLVAISPLFMDFAKNSRFFTLIPFIVYPFLFVLFQISIKKSKAFFLLGLLLGIMLNFHYTPLMLIPFIVSIFIWKRIIPSKKELAKFIGGFILPLSPFFLYDLSHRLVMTRNLLLWIPYRILGFLGIYHKNTISASILQENTLSFGNFFSNSFFHTTNSFLGYVVFGILIVTFFYIVRYSVKSKKYFLLFIFLWGVWGLVAIFVHGNPPTHYFVPILSFPILIGSLVLTTIWIKQWGKIITIILLALFTIINFQFFFSTQWFYEYKVSPRSFAKQEEVAKSIIVDAHGKPFALKRVGFNDQFDKNYAQNYIYLLWLYGNEPTNQSYRTYIIYDSPSVPTHPLPANETIFKKFPGLAIIREDL